MNTARSLAAIFLAFSLGAFCSPELFAADKNSADSAGKHPRMNSRSTKDNLHIAGASWKTDLAESERFLEKKDYPAAETCAQAAVDQLKKMRPRLSDELVLCQLQLADIIYKQDRFDEALPIYLSSYHITQRTHGKNSSLLIPIMLTIGSVYEVDGNYKMASEFYDSAVLISVQIGGADCLDSVLPRQRFARVKAKQGETKIAEELDLLDLSILMKQNKLPSSNLLEELLADYTDILLKSENQGKPLTSSFQNELLKDQIFRLIQKQGTASSKWTRDVSGRLSDGSISSGAASASTDVAPVENGRIRLTPEPDTSRISPDVKYSDPLALEEINKQRVLFYERLIASDIDSLGADHPSVARDLSGLASIYLAAKHYDDAKPLLQRSLEIYQKIYKDDAAPIRQTRLLLELLAESKDDQKFSIDRTFVQTLPKIPAEAQTLGVSLRLNDLAFMLYCRGNIDTSLQVYGWALAATSAVAGDNSILTASSMIDMSKLLRLNGRSAEAEKLENNAKAIARQDILEKRSLLLQ